MIGMRRKRQTPDKVKAKQATVPVTCVPELMSIMIRHILLPAAFGLHGNRIP
jgi:hypothetical protein